MKATVQIQKRFQVTVPEAVKRLLDLKEGDFLELDISKIAPEKKEGLLSATV